MTVFSSICEDAYNYFIIQLFQIGFLALPYALRQTGWCGLILLIGCGLVMMNTALMFGRSRRKFPLENFSDHVEVRVNILICDSICTYLFQKCRFT